MTLRIVQIVAELGNRAIGLNAVMIAWHCVTMPSVDLDLTGSSVFV